MGIIDTEDDWLAADDLAGEDTTQIPLALDGFERDQLCMEQQAMPEYGLTGELDLGYELEDRLLYTHVPPSGKAARGMQDPGSPARGLQLARAA